ncbi:MAG: hypothetical protein A2Y74_03200 [Actinobacteria bacterium RBG_13_63_9]|nr:MAG: hypothetical protein A2Y74_03200 [Actinobacteria bacterium RBG_13_63_9]
MTDVEYDVAYVARSPARLAQDEFAEMVNDLCNRRADEGWRLVSAVGDYGTNVTLGVWLVLAKEAQPRADEPRAETDADEGVPRATGWGEESESDAQR